MQDVINIISGNMENESNVSSDMININNNLDWIILVDNLGVKMDNVDNLKGNGNASWKIMLAGNLKGDDKLNLKMLLADNFWDDNMIWKMLWANCNNWKNANKLLAGNLTCCALYGGVQDG